MTMRQIAVMALVLCCAACIQQENGNPVRLAQPFVSGSQEWRIAGQATAPDGSRICTVSSGELQVTQRAGGDHPIVTVSTINKLDPGERYKVLADRQVYESTSGSFDARQSQAIVQDMMAEPVIYTELRRLTLRDSHASPVYRSIDNKIPRDGFAQQYEACKRFVE